MSLQPFRPVDRRASWRERLPLWDRETFQPLQVAHLSEPGNATIAFALFRERDDYRWMHGWRDYGWARPWCCRPVLSVSTDDGTGCLTLEAADPAQAVMLNVPPYNVSGLHEGVYRASLVAAYPDGSVLDLGSDLVTVTGEPFATGVNTRVQPTGPSTLINGVYVTMQPILPTPCSPPPCGAQAAPVLAGINIGAYLATLPTTLPSTPGQPWNDGGVIAIS